MAADNMAENKKRDLFLSELDDGCTYTDGYQCHQSDPRFFSQQALQSLVPAVYLPAWTVAYQAFNELPDLSDAQKSLTHYKVGFAEEDDQIVVLFSPLLLPYFDGDEPQGISRGAFGQSVKFWIDKAALKVTKQLFLK